MKRSQPLGYLPRRRGTDHIGVSIDPEVLSTIVESGAQAVTTVSVAAISRKRAKAKKKTASVEQETSVVVAPAAPPNRMRTWGPYILAGALTLSFGILLFPPKSRREKL